MTNREESEAAEHETYPGPGPLRADEGKRGIHPVEQMVDAAIDRIAREREAARTGERDPGHALALAPRDGSPSGLATTRRSNGKLRWKGLEVSDEFRNYAERVARGEDLPPYKGRILAEADAAFPWEPAARKSAARKARRLTTVLWGAGAALVGLASWSLVVQLGSEADAWRRAGESALSTTALSNQPKPEPTASPELAVELTPSASGSTAATDPPVSDTADAPAAAAVGSTALVGLTMPTQQARAASVAPGGAPSQHLAAETPKPSAQSNAVGVFVATRAPSSEVPSGEASQLAGSASALPLASNGATRSAGASDSSSVSSNGSLGASSPVASSDGSAAAGQADPKKEPNSEASAMGALLVETPSF